MTTQVLRNPRPAGTKASDKQLSDRRGVLLGEQLSGQFGSGMNNGSCDFAHLQLCLLFEAAKILT